MTQDSQRQRVNEQPATIRQLREKFPDTPSDFILHSVEEGWTIRQATDRFIDHVRAERADRDREIAALTAKNAELKEIVAAGDMANGPHNQSLPNPLNTKRRPTT